MEVTKSEYYKERISSLSKTLSAHKKRHAILGWLRLAITIIAVIAVFKLWGISPLVLIMLLIACIGVFLFLVNKALDTEFEIKNTRSLISICEKELLVLNGHYSMLNDGTAMMEKLQLHENDLDLFGKASLFQYINRGNSFYSQWLLAKSFIETTTRQQVELKQEAVKELSGQIEWCQQLQSFSHEFPLSEAASIAIQDWLKEEENAFTAKGWQVLRFGIPVISFSILAIYLAGNMSDGMFNTLMLLILAFVFIFYKKISKAYDHLSKKLPELNALLPALKWIESKTFNAAYLKEIQQKLETPQKASTAIGELKGILKRLDYRLNPIVYIPLSIFLFWDLQQVLALQRWKKKQRAEIEHWFETTGAFEMISALAVLSFNNPSWVFPEICDDWFRFKCEKTGHPLLLESKAVLNDFNMQGTPSITLITGSNMAGKSTFLRTIGANMVLGMTGAPVHAVSFTMPVVKVISSMRITDNLDEGTSTFYAELKKMKRIVDAANAGEKVFILIDEMLRGTNTIDRHTGSVALVKQLIRHNAVAMIASHDLALAALENEYPQTITNYHFDSTIIDNEIVFDYKLKQGVCQSTNASLLMQKIGIEMGE